MAENGRFIELVLIIINLTNAAEHLNCELCDMDFKYKSHLDRHLKSKKHLLFSDFCHSSTNAATTCTALMTMVPHTSGSDNELEDYLEEPVQVMFILY